jgi:hypothetical protein
MQSLMYPEYALVTDLDTAIARARAGAAYLDRRVAPGWDQTIDLDRLDIASPFSCVLAQLGQAGYFTVCFPGAWRVIEYGFSCGILEDLMSLVYRPRKLARAFELLTEAWRIVLSERREAWPGADVRRHAGSGRLVERETGIAV